MRPEMRFVYAGEGHPAIGPAPLMEPSVGNQNAAGTAADSCAEDCPVEVEVTSWAGQREKWLLPAGSTIEALRMRCSRAFGAPFFKPVKQDMTMPGPDDVVHGTLQLVAEAPGLAACNSVVQ